MERMRRPAKVALPSGSNVPPGRLLLPPPTEFTHRVAARPLRFHYELPLAGAPPAGHLAGGAPVLVVRVESRGLCRVLDQRGLYVVVRRAGLAAVRVTRVAARRKRAR